MEDAKGTSGTVFPEGAYPIGAASAAHTVHVAAAVECDSAIGILSIRGRCEAVEDAKGTSGTVFPEGAYPIGAAIIASSVHVAAAVECDPAIGIISI